MSSVSPNLSLTKRPELRYSEESCPRHTMSSLSLYGMSTVNPYERDLYLTTASHFHDFDSPPSSSIIARAIFSICGVKSVRSTVLSGMV